VTTSRSSSTFAATEMMTLKAMEVRSYLWRRVSRAVVTPSAYRWLMSIFGRKTFRAGPVRFTLSKSGLSESIGTRRARINLNGKGRVRKSINFGHGFRWTK